MSPLGQRSGVGYHHTGCRMLAVRKEEEEAVLLEEGFFKNKKQQTET